MRTSEAKRRGVRIVAIGGGTGLPLVLRGFKALLFPAGADDRTRLTGVVAVTDDGGSSGRLRGELGMLAPGDLRNCLVALSHNEPLMARLFQARYRDGETLSGHSVGNLILAALAQEEQGSFLAAVRLASDVLNIQGRVMPSTLAPARLVARLDDGREVIGESAIKVERGRVVRLGLTPAAPPTTPGVVEAILQADIVVLGPGSLYSSILSNLALPDVARAVLSTPAFRILVINAMTEPGETGGCTAAEHVRAVLEHLGGSGLDAALLANDEIPAATLESYRAEGAQRVEPTDPDLEALLPLVARERLLQVTPVVRHDPVRTARALLAAHATWRAAGARPAGGAATVGER